MLDMSDEDVLHYMTGKKFFDEQDIANEHLDFFFPEGPGDYLVKPGDSDNLFPEFWDEVLD